MYPPRPRRPVGIVLSAMALGLAALVLVLLAFAGIGTALLGSHGGTASGTPSPVTPAVAAGVMLVFALLYGGLAAWAIATLVGLLRMRPWARISTMVIAGGLALLGLFSVVGLKGVQSAFASGSFPMPPNASPDLLHKMFTVMEAMSLVLAALSIGWFIYLALRRTREAFTQAHAHRQAQQFPHGMPYPPAPGYPPYVVPGASPAWTPPRQPPAPNPLTDFTVARPLAPPPAEPIPPTDLSDTPADASAYPQPYTAPYAAPAYWPQQAPPWPVAPPAAPGRPVSVTVIAVFSLISAFFSLFGLISPFPTFLFGFMVGGWPLHLYSLVWSAAMAIAGLGMLRLQRPAWLLSFVLLGISSLNCLTFLLPGPRARYVAYMAAMQQRTTFGMPQPALPASFLTMTLAFGMFFGVALIVTAAILLWRARGAFAPPTPTPELPNEPTVE